METIPFDSEKGEKLFMEGFLYGWDESKTELTKRKGGANVGR